VDARFDDLMMEERHKKGARESKKVDERQLFLFQLDLCIINVTYEKRKETKMEQLKQYDEIVVKLRKLPEPLVHEVNDFVDFLLARHDPMLAESDFSDYLPNLEDYEERLARGEIKW
jgi:hypothetical protein